MFGDPKSHARLEVSASSSDSSVLLTERGTSVLKRINTSESVHTFCSQRSTESTGRVCRRGLTPLAERLGRMAGVMPGTQFSGAVCCRSAFQTIQTFSHNKCSMCSRCRIEFWTLSTSDPWCISTYFNSSCWEGFQQQVYRTERLSGLSDDGKMPGLLRPKKDPALALPSVPDMPHFEESDCHLDLVLLVLSHIRSVLGCPKPFVPLWQALGQMKLADLQHIQHWSQDVAWKCVEETWCNWDRFNKDNESDSHAFCTLPFTSFYILLLFKYFQFFGLHSLHGVAVVDMRSVILASPVVLPAAVGVFVVALLSLRRGRQPWLEAGL